MDSLSVQEIPEMHNSGNSSLIMETIGAFSYLQSREGLNRKLNRGLSFEIRNSGSPKNKLAQKRFQTVSPTPYDGLNNKTSQKQIYSSKPYKPSYFGRMHKQESNLNKSQNSQIARRDSHSASLQMGLLDANPSWNS